MERSVTPLETIRIASMGNLVDIPGFADGEMITVQLRRPNMLTLMKSGKIPNDLMDSVADLFPGTKSGLSQESSQLKIKNIAGLMEVFCEACLVNPTWQELTDAGIELTMDQMTFIFNYAQGGVKELKPFRDKRKRNASSVNGSKVSVPSKSTG